MTAFDDFVAERRLRPWPAWEWGMDGAPAQELYEAYRARMEELDRPVKNPNEFAEALREAGFERERRSGGYFWWGLTVRTREERARVSVCFSLNMKEVEEITAPHWAGHRKRVHADGSSCDHGLPDEIRAEVLRERDARLSALERDGTIDRLIEERYGPYLRWRPGDELPRVTVQRERRRRERMEAAAELPEALELLANLRARYQKKLDEYVAANKDLPPFDMSDPVSSERHMVARRYSMPNDLRQAVDRQEARVKWLQELASQPDDADEVAHGADSSRPEQVW